jgi:hypothetical protein
MRYGSIIVTLLAFALLGATEWQHAQARMNRVDVHVDRPGDYVFLLEEEIASDVQHFIGDTLGSSPAEINIALLEEFIASHPAVAGTEVYLDFAGILHCKIRQRLPVLYVSGDAFKGYWDASGHQFFGDEGNRGKCAELTHVSDSAMLLRTISFVDAMQTDSIWLEGPPRLAFNAQDELEIQPHEALYKVVWGSPDLDSSRLARWYFFNREILPRAGSHHYKRINLKYKDQIVALKNE